MQNELLRCPFCGSAAELVEEHDHFWIKHDGCSADLGSFSDASEATGAWNRRALSAFPSDAELHESAVPDGESERRNCNHCSARFWTVWERQEHERERHPVLPGLPKSVVDLVTAAREFLDTGYPDDPEDNPLSIALEAFESLVPYDSGMEAGVSADMLAGSKQLPITNVSHAYLVQALREIADLRDSEVAEPFDDALDIADAALSAYAAPTPPAAVQEPGAVKAEQKPYGHWVKHRLADGAFLPAGCYVPSGTDYIVVPLYTHAASANLSFSETESHTDDLAVDRFAAAMKGKLAKKRDDGRGGWDSPDECSITFLSDLLREHVGKGDPVDVGNLAMMIHQRGGRIV